LWSAGARNNVTCPFHDDVHPSLSVGLKDGGARCWAASCSSGPWGNIIHFEAAKRGVSEEDAARILYEEFVRPIIGVEQLATLQSSLASDAPFRDKLAKHCGLDSTAISVFRLGLDKRKQRLAIPIFDRWGNCVNVRLYKPPFARTERDEDFKVLNWAKGFGALDLFSWPHFLKFDIHKPVFVMASEKEMMIATSHGLQAICSTCGEDSWDEEWTALLTGFDICIVGQNDDGGVKAADKRYRILSQVAVNCVNLKIATSQKDFADWVVKDGGSGVKLLALWHKAAHIDTAETPAEIQTKSKATVPVDRTTPELPKFWSDDVIELAAVGTRTEMLDLMVKCHGIVAAKATHTYTVPWKFVLKPKNSPPKRFAYKMGREIISFVNSSDAYIRESLRLQFNDDKLGVEPTDYLTITEVEIIPTAAVDRDVPYVVQRCYFVGRWIDANVPYEFEIIPTTEVKSQKTVGIVVKATPIAMAFDNLKFSPEDIATLQIFRPEEPQTVWGKLEEIAEQLCTHYTKIFNRPDWHMVALLTWASPIGWKFPNETDIQRGWLNSLALGDTETGKSKVVKTLQAITRCGQFVNSENCTYVGLIGGAIKMGSGQLMLRWGRIPLCDKQLVVLEELSGLTVEQISNMSDVRSSGVARLDKGGLSSETNARTRLLALSNVRSKDKGLAAYTSGVRAVQELVGHAEDIARFDLIITLVDADVSLKTINQPARRERFEERIFQPADLQRLIQFCWSLKPEQIRFSTDAYYACLEKTIELAEIYHPAVPLFKGGSGRYKIARIAASIATLQFAWDEERKAIIVNEEHVEAAVQLMKQLYNKAPLKYEEWSTAMFDREEVKDIAELDDILGKYIAVTKKRSKVIEALIHSAKFNRDELCAIAGVPIIHADDMIGVFLRNRVIRKGDANLWEITPPGKRWLQTHEASLHHTNGNKP